LDLRSPGIDLDGRTMHLLTIDRAVFALDPATGHLMAGLRAYYVTVASAAFDVHGAVLGSRGQLLGVARSAYAVHSIGDGMFLHDVEVVSLDFGASSDYETAHSFLFAINPARNELSSV
jgi:hypothetical protein